MTKMMMVTAGQATAQRDKMTMTIATARRATKLTMMATMTTMATGDNDDDVNGATGDGATVLSFERFSGLVW